MTKIKLNKKIDRLPSIWSILPEELVKIKYNYQKYLEGELKYDKKALKEKDEQLEDFPNSFFTVQDNIAIMNIGGVLTPKGSFFSFLFGGSTLDIMTRDFNRLVDDERIKAIILEIDSPGGSVFGIQEFANLVYESRERKRIYSITNAMMTSAAYWIGSASNQVFITDNSTITGSIGVVIEHIDISELERKIGIKTTEITAGKYKRIASNVRPLSDEGREELQRQVDHVYNSFVSDIAKFRNTSLENVLENMADGKLFIGNQAIEAGLADNMLDIDSLVEIIEQDLEKENINNLFGGVNVMSTTNTDVKKLKSSLLTLEALQEKYPDLYAEVYQAGYEKAQENYEHLLEKQLSINTKEQYEKGLTEGIEKERNRIKAVEEQSMAGHEKLIDKLKYDGVTTGAEAAVQILKAEKEQRSLRLETLEKEAIKPIENSLEKESTAKTELTLDEQWQNDEAIRKEFRTLEAFKAFNQNKNYIRILSRKS